MATPFAFRMRAYAAAHFAFEEYLTINFPDAVAVLQSEYTGGAEGRAYPVTIHGEIRGEAESIEEAERRLSGLIGETLAPLALAGNAAIADPLAVATYGTDPSEPQPFIGYRTPEPSEFFPPGDRRFDLQSTGALVAAIGAHPETELLRRAAEAYRHALGYFTPEARLLAGEFLYISSEVLSRFLIERRAREAAMTPKNLARAAGLPGAEKLRARYLDEIFAGDTAARKSLEKASNGFEHGYMASGDVVDLVDTVLERSFGLIRSALITAGGIGSTESQTLLSRDYAEPRTLLPTLNVVKGELSPINPGMPTAELPVGAVDLRWRGGEPVVTEVGGEVQIEYAWNIEAIELPANTQFRVLAQGLRAAYVKPVPPTRQATDQS